MSDPHQLTKSQVRKAGNTLRRQLRERSIGEVEHDPGNAAAWDIVRRFQRSHVQPKDAVASRLAQFARTLDVAPPASRLKRAERIIEKIARSSSSLDSLQDIGGCRIVVPDLRAQQRATETLIDFEVELVSLYDYVASPGTSPFPGRSPGPKGSGYRAIHIVHRVDTRLIETQIRTASQHRWAMAAEDAEQITGFPVKSGDAPTEIFDYFRIAASIEAVKEHGAFADPDLVHELAELRERIRVYYRRTRYEP